MNYLKGFFKKTWTNHKGRYSIAVFIFPHTISSIQFQSKSQCVISWSPSGKLTACWGEEDSRRLVWHFFLCYTGKSRDVIKTCTFSRGTQPPTKRLCTQSQECKHLSTPILKPSLRIPKAGVCLDAFFIVQTAQPLAGWRGTDNGPERSCLPKTCVIEAWYPTGGGTGRWKTFRKFGLVGRTGSLGHATEGDGWIHATLED